MWHMPLDDDYKDLLKSAFADLANIGGRWGGAISAAWFLKEFAEDTPGCISTSPVRLARRRQAIHGERSVRRLRTDLRQISSQLVAEPTTIAGNLKDPACRTPSAR